MEISDILKRLKSLANPQAPKWMAKYGITPKSTYGVSIPNLRKIAKEIEKDHELAQQLWELNIRETRILASMIDDSVLVTEKQMERWVKDFDYWEVCDQVCQNLFIHTKFAYKKALEWSGRNEEFVKRAGFTLMAWLAFKDRNASDEQFEKFLPIIKKESIDNRNMVKKAVNWALRQIGKRNLYLNRKVIETAKEIQKMDSRSAKWIAYDAIRELTDNAVQERLHKKIRRKQGGIMTEYLLTSLHQESERLFVHNFKQFGGEHCETSSLMKVLNYHGLFLSENMLLGLGGGIGFIYWFTKKMPYPFIGTRNGRFPHFISKICERVGVKLIISQTTSAKKGYKELKDILRTGEPAIVYGDIGFLPYFGSPDAHFGGHAFVVYGVDEENDKACISDRAIHPVIISISDLQKARGSTFPPFSPRHALLKFKDFPLEVEDIEKKSIEAILECCENMLRPPIENIGLAGMQKWANIIKKWPVQFEGKALFNCLISTFINIETGGTGGNAFRTMYAQFLEEISSFINNPSLSDIAEMFRESSKIWGKISADLLPDNYPTLKKTRELIIEKDYIFKEQSRDAAKKMRTINEELGIIEREAKEDLKKASVFLTDVSQNISKCLEIEKKAFRTLEASLKA